MALSVSIVSSSAEDCVNCSRKPVKLLAPTGLCLVHQLDLFSTVVCLQKNTLKKCLLWVFAGSQPQKWSTRENLKILRTKEFVNFRGNEYYEYLKTFLNGKWLWVREELEWNYSALLLCFPLYNKWPFWCTGQFSYFWDKLISKRQERIFMLS